jgi:hypothetical protein
MSCGNGAKIGINFVMGYTFVPAPVDVDFHVGDKQWTSWKQGGTDWPKDAVRVRIGQAFISGDQWFIDIADESESQTVAQLRLVQAIDGREFALGGTFHVIGQGAWAVSCDSE